MNSLIELEREPLAFGGAAYKKLWEDIAAYQHTYRFFDCALTWQFRRPQTGHDERRQHKSLTNTGFIPSLISCSLVRVQADKSTNLRACTLVQAFCLSKRETGNGYIYAPSFKNSGLKHESLRTWLVQRYRFDVVKSKGSEA